MNPEKSEKYVKAVESMNPDVDVTKMYETIKQSQSYFDYRTRYSPEFFKYIVDYTRKTRPELELCVDVGCGPGISTLGFVDYFKKLVGVDVSECQIACAPKDIPNAEFRVGYSHILPFIETGTCDLFCSGEAFNLMPRKETFAEADRILKPGGTIALFGYNTFRCGNKTINDVFIPEVFMKIIPYWPKESQSVYNKFRDIDLPYAEYERNEDMVASKQMTVPQLMGLLDSLFPYISYCEAHPDENFPAVAEKVMRDVVKKVHGSEDAEFEFIHDLFVLIGRKPLK